MRGEIRKAVRIRKSVGISAHTNKGRSDAVFTVNRVDEEIYMRIKLRYFGNEGR